MEEDVAQSETRHEAHEHARSRTVLSVIAILCLLVAGGLVWTYWGEEIQEACFGDGEVCTVDLNGNS